MYMTGEKGDPEQKEITNNNPRQDADLNIFGKPTTASSTIVDQETQESDVAPTTPNMNLIQDIKHRIFNYGVLGGKASQAENAALKVYNTIMSFLAAIKHGFQHYFNFKDKTNRSEFWFFSRPHKLWLAYYSG